MEDGGATGGGNDAGKWSGVVVGGGRVRRSVIAAQKKKAMGSENAGIVFPVGRTARYLRKERYDYSSAGSDDDDVFFGPWMNFYALEAEEEKRRRRRRLLTLLLKLAVWMLITTIITKMLLPCVGVGKSGLLGISRKVLIVLCYIHVAVFVRKLVLPPLWRIATRIVGARDAPPRARLVYTCRLGVILPDSRRHR